jgi:hypothetical protein
VGNHQVNCNLKAYEHEQSPCDDMFRGVISYDEVLARFQNLSPNLQNDFLNFQKHRRSGLPEVLLGEASTQPLEKENFPLGFEKEGQSRKSPTGYGKAPTKQRGLIDKKIIDRSREEVWDLSSLVSLLPLHHLVLMSIRLR